ncbi:SDR family oxidoreductase [Brevibacterium atlanticum]|uniref:SDR family oxidoreductase n=1 Tax=Brevibacterium atlanticum TaxID=2697563 RepID=UPI00141EF245|nr:SDR family oxidoreductase [Brevibacterium atlanticum]
MNACFDGSVALVTGGQRGLGRAFADELLRRGATLVYVTSRHPEPTGDTRIVPLELDVTDDAQVAALPDSAPNVNLLINSAGVSVATPLLQASWEDIIGNFEANAYGPLRVVRAMAPVLAGASPSRLVNVHSVLSWIAGYGAYGASKAALWAISNQLRIELAGQGTTVTGVHLGLADTDMTAGVPGPKLAPDFVAATVLDGVANGATEVLVDEISQTVKNQLSGPVEALVLGSA